MDRNRLIGRDNALPWRLPADLAFFKRTTMGKAMLMGRRTWDSLGGPLPGREHIVLTRSADFHDQGCSAAASIEAALAMGAGYPELMVIGGASIYAQTLPFAQRMYLTLIDAAFDGDAWFPNFDAEQWREVDCEAHPPDERNRYPYTFVTLERSRPAA